MVIKYSKQTENFGKAFVRLTYNDGKIVEPLSKHYNGLKRKGMKSVTVVSASGIPLYTLVLKNDKLIYRLRNTIPSNIAKREIFKKYQQDMGWNNPKRCFVLATEGKVVFVWDSGETKEFTDWQDENPYHKPTIREDEQ